MKGVVPHIWPSGTGTRIGEPGGVRSGLGAAAGVGCVGWDVLSKMISSEESSDEGEGSGVAMGAGFVVTLVPSIITALD